MKRTIPDAGMRFAGTCACGATLEIEYVSGNGVIERVADVARVWIQSHAGQCSHAKFSTPLKVAK